MILLQKSPQNFARNMELRRLQAMQKMASDRTEELKELINSLLVEYHKEVLPVVCHHYLYPDWNSLGFDDKDKIGIGMSSVSSLIFTGLLYYFKCR